MHLIIVNVKEINSYFILVFIHLRKIMKILDRPYSLVVGSADFRTIGLGFESRRSPACFFCPPVLSQLTVMIFCHWVLLSNGHHFNQVLSRSQLLWLVVHRHWSIIIFENSIIFVYLKAIQYRYKRVFKKSKIIMLLRILK